MSENLDGPEDAIDLLILVSEFLRRTFKGQAAVLHEEMDFLQSLHILSTVHTIALGIPSRMKKFRK